MKRTHWLVLFLLLGSFSRATDQQRIDSLLAVSRTIPVAPAQVRALNQVSVIYAGQRSRSAKDSSLFYSQQAIAMARRIGDSEGLAEALYDLGKYYVGVAGSPAKATENLLESLELYTQLNDRSGISMCHMQLGLVSYILKYYEDAVKNLDLSLKAEDNPTATYLMALSYTELDSFSLAKAYFSRAITDYTDRANAERLAECHLYLGRLYLRTGALDSALYYMKMAMESRALVGDPRDMVRPYAFVSEVYLRSNDLDRAIHFAERSYELETGQQDKNQDMISLIQATKTLSEAYALKGRYEKAYFFLDLYNKASDRDARGSIKQKVADMQSMFDFEQRMNLQQVRQEKDREIAQAQIAKERILRNAFLVGTVLLLLLPIGLYKRYRFKRRSNQTLVELNEEVTREKERSDHLLLNILPEDVAEELKMNGEAAARSIEHVTVLFTDFKGFIAVSEQLGPRELVHALNECFSAFDGIMEKWGIEKIKTIGDAYMAAGGLPLPDEGHARKVIHAAFEMRDFVEAEKARKIAAGAPYFEIRIGMHTGPVVAGIVGVKKFQYDIWGDTVNTASRMESSGEVGKVNISGSTYALVKDDPEFNFTPRGMIEAKGKGEMEMYFVERAPDRG